MAPPLAFRALPKRANDFSMNGESQVTASIPVQQAGPKATRGAIVNLFDRTWFKRHSHSDALRACSSGLPIEEIGTCHLFHLLRSGLRVSPGGTTPGRPRFQEKRYRPTLRLVHVIVVSTALPSC